MTYTPLQEIFPPGEHSARVFLKRDDLLHPEIQGNKWRKLAPLIQGLTVSKQGILSFGGAFSNHLHALAHAGKIYGFPTIGIVRGASVDVNNHSLAEARACGMLLFPVLKADYEVLKKTSLPDIYRHIDYKPDTDYTLLPEGGDTPAALIGCRDIAVEILTQLPPDAGLPVYICVPAGTGCTAAGVIAGAGDRAKTLLFPAAPYGVDMNSIRAKLQAAGVGDAFEFQIVEDVLPRKFAQMSDELLAFIQAFQESENVLLDPVYTSKMMFKLYEMLAQQFFPSGSCVVALHTGGLQGW